VSTTRPIDDTTRPGLGNTNAFKSYAVSLDGALANGLGYSLGHRRLGTDTPGESEENTTTFGLTYVWPEDSGLALSVMGEVGASRDADGIDGANRDFYTAGAQWGLGDWFVNAIVSGWNENATAGDLDLPRVRVFDDTGLQTARSDDQLPRETDQVHRREFTARTLLAVVV